MSDVELAFTPAWKQREMVASKAISPVELVKLYLRRIETLNTKLNAYITVAAEQALVQAKTAETALVKGEPLGPLHGVPISVKDLEPTKGIRTTIGSLVYRDTVPDRDSVVVERIRRSGAIIIGKTNTPEIGIHLSTLTENRLLGPCRNPWNLECTTGGSSGGAGAAMAAALCTIATGTDGGGSIRIPASFCGVYGLKPTQGRVPRAGGYGKSEPNQFAQSGPMTSCVRDAAVLLQVIAGPDPRDPQPYMRTGTPDFLVDLERGVKGLKLGWSRDLGYGAVDHEVEEVTYKAALVYQKLGCIVDKADIKLTNPHPHFWNIFTANLYAAYRDLLEKHTDLLTESARKSLEHGRSVTGTQYAQSLRAVNELSLQLRQTLEPYDLLITPTTSIPAFPPSKPPRVISGSEVHPIAGFYPYTFPFNMTGNPAASIPCGFVNSLPIGLQIVGHRGDDALVLRASAAFEQARPWADKHPQIAL